MAAGLIQLIKDQKIDEAIQVIKDPATSTSIAKIRDGQGATVAHWAAASNNIELLTALVTQHPKDVYLNAVDFRGASVLYYAASHKADKAVQWLVDRFVDPRPQSAFSGHTAAQAARDPKIRAILRAYTKRFESTGLKHPVTNFAYRKAQHFRQSMEALQHPNPDFYHEYPVYPVARKLFNGDDAKAMLQLVQLADAEYEHHLKPGAKLPTKEEQLAMCLVCTKDTDRQCPSCHTVGLCESCSSSKDEGLKCLVEIHTNNCEQGLFS